MNGQRVLRVRSPFAPQRQRVSHQAKRLAPTQSMSMTLARCSVQCAWQSVLSRAEPDSLVLLGPMEQRHHRDQPPHRLSESHGALWQCEQRTVALSHFCCRHSHCMRSALPVNGDMALDCRLCAASSCDQLCRYCCRSARRRSTACCKC